MATIVDFGRSPDFLGEAFFTDTASLQVVSSSSTRVEIRNPETGAISILTGTGLNAGVSGGEPFVTGTLTGVELRVFDGIDDVQNVVFSGISWNAAAFVLAVRDAVEFDDRTRINALLSLQPVTYDARNAVQGVEFSFAGVTSAITILGSPFHDELEGGNGNDSIAPGIATDFVDDLLVGSRGNDTYDLRGINSQTYVALGYWELAGPVTVNVNSAANTASVAKGSAGTDTILNVREAINADGLGFEGTEGNDTFNLVTDGGYVEVAAGAGNDTFNLTPGDTIRLNFHYGPGTRTGQGIVVDLATGIVSQDGFGGTDRINFLGGTGQLQIHGTDFADRILGSDRDETFILRSGNDTLDGRGGDDLVRYDRNGIDTGINANLQAGVVTGVWFGQAFRHQVTNVERLRGTFFDDTLRAADTGSRLEGRDGNDTIQGGAATDDLQGGGGDDVILPGSNTDYDDIETGAGFDEVIFDVIPAADGNAFFVINHWALENQTGIAVDIDALASTTGLIDKGGFGQTTLTDVQNALDANGLMIVGTALSDQFTISLGDGQWLEMQAGHGVDSYTIGGNGGVQINFDRDENWDWASQGLVVNLATGVVANDGFGFAEAIALDAGSWISIRGTRNADDFTGSNTSDSRFLALGGNDTIRGGTQWDSVEYDDRRFTSGVRVDLAAGTARGAFEGVAFAQQLSGIEGLVGTRDFADRLMGTRGANYIDGLGGNDVIFGDGFRAAFALSEARQVYRLYQATLDRAPDTTGQIDWTAKLAEGTQTLVQVAAGFTGSREFQNVYGALDNTAFVTLLYQNVLDRAPDAGGLATWVGQLNGGTSRAQVVTGFSESREFVNSTLTAANAFTQARNESGWTDDVFRLYQATLDRAPDAAGFVDWIGRLGGGTSFLSAVSGFVGSREFQRTYGALDDTAFVTLLYNNVLNRAPDAGGLADWLAKLSSGALTRAQVVEGFAQSREFVNATAQDLTDFVRNLNFAGEAAGIGGDEIRGGAGENRLWGGILADEFVFDADQPAHHRVMDLEAWDFLTFQDFGYAGDQDIRARMTQVGADVVFQDQGVTVTLSNTQLAAITDDSLYYS